MEFYVSKIKKRGEPPDRRVLRFPPTLWLLLSLEDELSIAAEFNSTKRGGGYAPTVQQPSTILLMTQTTHCYSLNQDMKRTDTPG